MMSLVIFSAWLSPIVELHLKICPNVSSVDVHYVRCRSGTDLIKACSDELSKFFFAKVSPNGQSATEEVALSNTPYSLDGVKVATIGNLRQRVKGSRHSRPNVVSFM